MSKLPHHQLLCDLANLGPLGASGVFNLHKMQSDGRVRFAYMSNISSTFMHKFCPMAVSETEASALHLEADAMHRYTAKRQTGVPFLICAQLLKRMHAP